MAYEEIGLDEEARARIAETLRAWAEVHPRRDLPLLELADGSQLTPRTMAAAAGEPRSRAGEYVLTMFELALADEVRGPHELDELLVVFARDTERWAEYGEGPTAGGPTAWQ